MSALSRQVLDRVGEAVVGKGEALELVLAGILAGGHVLLEDYPGLAKTLAARSFAQALGLEFRRVQFTPDLLPSDVTGAFVYDQRDSEFVFRPGPIFTGLLLADEINRTPPKTQAALLESMQEHQVTVEGQTFPLPVPFHVLATANPVEYEGTYPLPEAQLDRFMLRIGFGYPTAAEEWEVLQRRMSRRYGGPVRRGLSPTRPGCSPPSRRSRPSPSTTRSAGTASSSLPRPGGTPRCWSARPLAARSRCS